MFDLTSLAVVRVKVKKNKLCHKGTQGYNESTIDQELLQSIKTNCGGSRTEKKNETGLEMKQEK